MLRVVRFLLCTSIFLIADPLFAGNAVTPPSRLDSTHDNLVVYEDDDGEGLGFNEIDLKDIQVCDPHVDSTDVPLIGENQIRIGTINEPLEEKKFCKMPIIWENSDSIMEWATKLRMDSFYGKNLRLLNNCNDENILIPGRHVLDTSFIYRYGKASRGYDVMKVKGTLRNRYVWGNAESSGQTTFASIKSNEVVFGEHTHPITVNLLILRELWAEMVLNDILGVNWKNRQYLTVGLFPFQLGRGIALGDAYSTVPELLGYNPQHAINQFAPGFKLGGQIFGDCLTYDLYGAILVNRSSTFDDIFMKTQGQQIGRRNDQKRGSGVLNYVIASRFNWRPYNEPTKKLAFEPYWLFDNEKEQKLEFVGDASSKLFTIGLAGDMQFGAFEMGFDTAKNFGHQMVKAWDRNAIVYEQRLGVNYAVNSKVNAIADNPADGTTYRNTTYVSATNDNAGKKAIYTPANQDIINAAPQGVAFNGQQIGDSNLRNAADRFRPCYQNDYKGWMFVIDAAYKFCPEFKFAAALGAASGDDVPPNKDLITVGDSGLSGAYEGFIGLQEVYSGTRVRSAFLLAGSGRVPRTLSFPSPVVSDQLPALVSSFTNLVFYGNAIWAKYYGTHRTWDINPNILAYWQQTPARIFDVADDGSITSRCTSRFLGVELNTFVETMILTDLKLFAVGAFFIPGTFYKNIAGRALNKDQQKFFDELDVTGITTDTVPTLGTNAAFFLNVGFEYKF
jgi:hypothetical protein